MRRAAQRGQATFEYVLVVGTVMLPLTFAILVTAQVLWVWHSVADFTREGASYAATHCWQSSGDNVRNWMQAHVPLMVDMDRFRGGGAEIGVEYFQRDPATGVLTAFSCAAGECSAECVPDAVTVSVSNYEFRAGLLTFLGIGSIPIPDFHTTLAVGSAGCAADAAGVISCTP
jgi:hypothetical protein